jgi:hypothetical protein
MGWWSELPWNPDHGRENSMLYKSYKESSLNSTVELLKAGILYITVYNNNNNNNNNNNTEHLNTKYIEDQFVNIAKSYESNEPNTDSTNGRKSCIRI